MVQRELWKIYQLHCTIGWSQFDKGYQIARINMLLKRQMQTDVSVIQTVFTNLNHACLQRNQTFTSVNFLFSQTVFTTVSISINTREIYT